MGYRYLKDITYPGFVLTAGPFVPTCQIYNFFFVFLRSSNDESLILPDDSVNITIEKFSNLKQLNDGI